MPMSARTVPRRNISAPSQLIACSLDYSHSGLSCKKATRSMRSVATFPAVRKPKERCRSGMVEHGIYENVKADVEENRQAGQRHQTRHDCTQFGADCEKRLRPRLSRVFRCASPEPDRHKRYGDAR